LEHFSFNPADARGVGYAFELRRIAEQSTLEVLTPASGTSR